MSDNPFPQAHFPEGLPVDEHYFVDDDEATSVPDDVADILGDLDDYDDPPPLTNDRNFP